MAPTVAQLLRDHVSLSIACIDRIYVNGYLPSLQTSGQLVYFLAGHRGNPIASPAVLGQITDRFRDNVRAYAEQFAVPMVNFERRQRKDDIANDHRRHFEAGEGVVFIGVAQERMKSFKAKKRCHPNGFVDFEFSRQPVAVNHYYFYVQDPEWGPAFIKVGSYAPFPVKLCLNGHEWAKQQLRHLGVGFTSLDNGFLTCEEPGVLQNVCDALRPDDLVDFFDRWSERLPWPLTKADRIAGFDHALSIWQLEVSVTQVFDRPVQGRHFFEQVIRDNIDLGRPDRVSLLFPTRPNRRTPSPRGGYRTRVITSGVQPSLHVEYKHSHVKQYFKEERALRTETTINDPGDFRAKKSVRSLYQLRDIGHDINAKLLEIERISEDCVLTQHALDHLQRSTVTDGKRASALRFGDTRVMALLHALCMFLHLPFGFQNRELREHVAALLGLDSHTYSSGRMTYDLRRLRLKELIERQPGTNRYYVTPLGLRVAYFYTKMHIRSIRPGWAAIAPDDPIPRPLQRAFAQLDAEINRLRSRALFAA